MDFSNSDLMKRSEEDYTIVWGSKPKGIWKIGVKPVMFGVRAIAWRDGSFGPSVDYCSGDNEVFLIELLFTIKKILSKYPETITEIEVEEMMPMWQRRPIDKDPCWDILKEMAFSSPYP